MKSIQSGSWNAILGAVAGGMDVDSWDSVSGGTLLWKAIEMGSYNAAKTLIKFGANVNYKAENGKTALMIAVEKVSHG